MSLAVTATGTEVGKTVVSALLLARYPGASYWKPVATGSIDERDVETVRRLAPEGTRCQPEDYLFGPPVSPHLAARKVDETIEVETLRQRFAVLAETGPWVVEGIGGVLVPLDDRGTSVADLFTALDLPCLVVASSGLGTLNHTFLTLEALRHRSLVPVGVVLVGPRNFDNRQAIESMGEVEVLAEVPFFEPLDRAALTAAADRFDPGERLAPYLGSGPTR